MALNSEAFQNSLSITRLRIGVSAASAHFWASANLGIVVSSNYRWNSCPSLLSYDRPDLALISIVNTSVGFATSGASSITVAGGSSFHLVFLCRILLLKSLWDEPSTGPLYGFRLCHEMQNSSRRIFEYFCGDFFWFASFLCFISLHNVSVAHNTIFKKAIFAHFWLGVGVSFRFQLWPDISIIFC